MARTKTFKLELLEDNYLDLSLLNETIVTENYNYARILQRVNKEYTKPSVGISNLLLYILSSAMWCSMDSDNSVKKGNSFIVDGKKVSFINNQFEVQVKPHIIAGILGITTKSKPNELKVTKLTDKELYCQFNEVKKIQGVSVELCKVTKNQNEKLIKDMVSHVIFPSIRLFQDDEGNYTYSFSINNALIDLLIDKTGGWGMINIIQYFCLPVSAKPVYIFMCRNKELIENQFYNFNTTGKREYIGHKVNDELLQQLNLIGYKQFSKGVFDLQKTIDKMNSILGTTLAFDKVYDKNDERKINRLRFYFN
ncbi:hypothetical protein [Clostridium perfringens]|uniref:hypothetical protein n=1 Tax=Clostridium perfringens TaxID=1502 RepID=UPI0032DB0454